MKRDLMIVFLVLVIFTLASCTKGNVLTGSTVVDIPTDSSEEESQEDESKESDSESEEDSEQEADSQHEEKEPQEELLDDATPPDYSTSAGKCSEGADGAVRAIDEEGQKTVYRAKCFGDRLVKYSCDGDSLDTEFEDCSKGCVVEKYVGKCA